MVPRIEQYVLERGTSSRAVMNKAEMIFTDPHSRTRRYSANGFDQTDHEVKAASAVDLGLKDLRPDRPT